MLENYILLEPLSSENMRIDPKYNSPGQYRNYESEVSDRKSRA